MQMSPIYDTYLSTKRPFHVGLAAYGRPLQNIYKHFQGTRIVIVKSEIIFSSIPVLANAI